MMPAPWQSWVTKSWRRAIRVIQVRTVKNDEVRFVFKDSNQMSRCSLSAFLRTYQPEELI